MSKDHSHELFNDGVVRLGEAWLWWDDGRGSGAGFEWGNFRLSSLARSIISSLVITPFCSRNSPMASSSYSESIDISTGVRKAFGSTESGIGASYRAISHADNGSLFHAGSLVRVPDLER